MKPVFIDFEASSLSPDSYPIEVAWGSCDSDLRSYLIDPSGVDSWVEWDEFAEAEIHRISRSMLFSEGVPTHTVARALSESIGGTVVYSDAPEFDTFWMERLFDAVDLECSITIKHVELVIPRYHESVMTGVAEAVFDGLGLPRHRAGNDVMSFFALRERMMED